MAIAILAAQTGQGHISVMKSIEKELKLRGYNDIKTYPDFYEKMMVSNKILSDFYNFLLSNSPQLCNQYCEFTSLTKSDMSEDFYNGAREFLREFFTVNKFDIIISVSHSINYVIIKVLKELELYQKVKFYIVITDPYVPIAVGFATPGANKYICASDGIKDMLIKSKINEKDIFVTGYPIDSKFADIGINIMYKKTNSSQNVKTILINSGSNGTYYYYDILKEIIHKDYQIIFICGKNKLLYQKCNRFVEKNNYTNKCKIFQYVDNMQEYLANADLVIAKPGANTFFEIMQMQIPFLVDALQGTIYQEKGIKKYIESKGVGEILYELNEINCILDMMLEDKKYLKYIENYKLINYKNGTSDVVDLILDSN